MSDQSDRVYVSTAVRADVHRQLVNEKYARGRTVRQLLEEIIDGHFRRASLAASGKLVIVECDSIADAEAITAYARKRGVPAV